MPDMSIFLKTFDLNVGEYAISPSYWQAGAIILLLFVLVLTMAQVRRHFLDWTAKGAILGLFFGFLLTLILEGFLMLSGKTIVTSVLGWKNPPKPISNALDLTRSKFVSVLGTNVSDLKDSQGGSDLEIITQKFQSLTPKNQDKFRFQICTP